MNLVPKLRCQRIMLPIVAADSLAQFSIGFWCTTLLDPAMFIRRYALGSQLTTNPLGRFGHYNPQPQPQRGQGRSAAAESTADNDDVGTLFLGLWCTTYWHQRDHG